MILGFLMDFENHFFSAIFNNFPFNPTYAHSATSVSDNEMDENTPHTFRQRKEGRLF